MPKTKVHNGLFFANVSSFQIGPKNLNSAAEL